MKLKLILYELCLCMSTVLQAQLKIVKDNIACTYGLKNEQNEWVVKAQFIDIQTLHAPSIIFETLSESGYVLIDKDGKELLPSIYKYIRYIQYPSHPPSHLIITNHEDKKGVFHPQMGMLFPVQYSHIVQDYPFNILFKTVNDSVFTTYVDRNFNITIPEGIP